MKGGRLGMNFSINEFKKVVAATTSLTVLALVVLFQTGSHAAAGPLTVDGSDTFKTKCASCHGANGAGNTAAGKALKVRDLSSSEVQAQTDNQLYGIVAKGKGKMPGFEKNLGADKCKELVAFIRTLKK
jgi:mono/diheme cytochrome c family protein